jgi:hypothetical protein
MMKRRIHVASNIGGGAVMLGKILKICRFADLPTLPQWSVRSICHEPNLDDPLLWIDAVCVNQEDKKEKEDQIPFMAGIYARAIRVIVWLEHSADDDDQELEVVRLAGISSIENLSHTNSFQQLIF